MITMARLVACRDKVAAKFIELATHGKIDRSGIVEAPVYARHHLEPPACIGEHTRFVRITFDAKPVVLDL